MAYFLSKIAFDIIPLRIVPPILMGGIMYYMIGLRKEWNHFLWFLLIMVLFNLVSGGMCLIIASISPSVAAANIYAIILILSNSLFGGFLLNKSTMPWYISWMQYLSFWNYAFEALLINELDGFSIVIDPRGNYLNLIFIYNSQHFHI